MAPDSSMVSSERRKGNGYKLKYRKFHLKLRKIFFPARVVKYRYRLLKEVVESSSLQYSKPSWTRP